MVVDVVVVVVIVVVLAAVAAGRQQQEVHISNKCRQGTLLQSLGWFQRFVVVSVGSLGRPQRFPMGFTQCAYSQATSVGREPYCKALVYFSVLSW